MWLSHVEAPGRLPNKRWPLVNRHEIRNGSIPVHRPANRSNRVCIRVQRPLSIPRQWTDIRCNRACILSQGALYSLLGGYRGIKATKTSLLPLYPHTHNYTKGRLTCVQVPLNRYRPRMTGVYGKPVFDVRIHASSIKLVYRSNIPMSSPYRR